MSDWWEEELKKHWGEGHSSDDTRRAAKVALDEIERLRKLAGGERGGEGMEREACARIAESLDPMRDDVSEAYRDGWEWAQVNIAAAIRSRGAGGEQGGEAAYPKGEVARPWNDLIKSGG